VCEMTSEVQQREVQYTVLKPEQRTRTRQVVNYRQVAEEQVQTYTVMVPYTEERTINVRVCRTVPQVVTYRVPVCGTCCN